ncbi:MAG: DUF262 domain-containing protein [Candidatus Nanohaloarchaea archaeon]
MDADTLNLQQIFGKDARYVVPTFQRQYVWSEEEHWKMLWNDLTQVVEKDLINIEKTDKEASPLFLGAIVLDQLTNKTSKLETREIIDGQQRLMTLQILMSAAYNVANKHGDDKQSNYLENLMYNNEDLVEKEEQEIKVRPIEPDQEAFLEVLNGKKDDWSEEEHSIIECYQFFSKEIEKWVEKGETDQKLEVLTDTLYEKVKMVVIDLDEEDDSQVIFETLNARGTPLLAGDLIKNYLLREAKYEDFSQEKLHEKYWKQFDEEYWREEVVQGRLERPRINVFIMHWLTMRTADQIRAKKLFPEFRKFLKSTDQSIKEVLQDIDHYADVYEDFSEPYSNDVKGKFLERIDIMDTTTPLPVMLWMYGNESIPEEKREKSVEIIESWLIRRMLCRETTKNYNKIFLDLLEKLQNSDPEKIDQEVFDFFSEKEGDSDYWPEDQKLEQSMVEEQYWSRINQRRLRMVFRALEKELRNTGKSETLEISQNLEIEHIMPQKWERNWELPGEKPREVETMERDEIKNTIGNLTVLTDELNPSVSNSGWEDKKQAIEEHTVLRLNQELVDNWEDEWNEDTIEERGRKLAETTKKVWPGPQSDYW